MFIRCIENDVIDGCGEVCINQRRSTWWQLTQTFSRFKQVLAHCGPGLSGVALEQLKYTFGCLHSEEKGETCYIFI